MRRNRRSALSARTGRRNVRPARSSARSGSSGQMSRSGFLRGLGVGAAGLGAAAVGLGGVASAHIVDLGGGACEVYPEDDPDHDVPAVQEAVATYTDVTLKSVAYGTPTPTPFNFGGDTVYIFTDANVHGEGTLATKVVGGLFSFMATVNLPDFPDPPNPTISNIWFDGAYFSPITLQTCNGATISGNKVTNVVAIDIGYGDNLAYGIAASELLGGTIEGTITIQGNIIDLFGPSYNPTNVGGAPGIGLHDFAGSPHFEILDNHISNAPDGILVGSFPYADANIIGNHVTNRVYQNIITGWASGCIFLIKHPYGYGKPGQARIQNNVLYQVLSPGDPDNEFHGIIMADSSDCTVTGNTINGEGTTGITLYYHHDQLYLTGNTISGNTVTGDFPQAYRAYDSKWAKNPADKLYYVPESLQLYPHLRENTWGSPNSGLYDLHIVNISSTGSYSFYQAGNTSAGYSLYFEEELNPHSVGPGRGPKIK